MKSRPHPQRTSRKTKAQRVVFLLDVDNTLLDNDRVADDLRRHLEREIERACQRQYWAIFEQLRAELGYADYLGALQRYRVEHAHDHNLFSISSFLMNYPFANRLYPNSLDVVERCKEWGTPVILSDGDVVFQPRKIERSGLFEAVERNVLIYIHKEQELAEVERRFPADHYVLVDDKVRILSAVKGITRTIPRSSHRFPRPISRWIESAICSNTMRTNWSPPGRIIKMHPRGRRHEWERRLTRRINAR